MESVCVTMSVLNLVRDEYEGPFQSLEVNYSDSME